jgi:hypothetical protein
LNICSLGQIFKVSIIREGKRYIHTAQLFITPEEVNGLCSLGIGAVTGIHCRLPEVLCIASGLGAEGGEAGAGTFHVLVVEIGALGGGGGGDGAGDIACRLGSSVAT